ncbi:hypothetical protein Patl1_23021 [Pistacia atlantica]|uniref:Uncharacterized protein n=1 Tax=Pistacia atlantica TaxID=434234 RepID=A0ACC0ZU60_9ROSI|nr:hypothetical protein Patl1_23021 [Pistacia atlantica]
MVARHKRHSKHWERSSPAQRQLDPRFNRLSIKSKRPSSTRRDFVPQYNRHSDDSEWPSPAPNNRHFLWRSPRHDVQSINVVMAARHKRHSKHWERSFPAQRQLDPRFNGLSIKSKRPFSTQREFVPQYNRHSDDSEWPFPAPNNRHFLWRSPRHDVQSFNVVMAARHKRHSKHWERSSPAQRQLDPRVPSPAPNNRHFLWRSPRHDVQSINVVMAARHKRHSKHWERSSPAQRQLDPRFNGLSIKSERPSSTRREFVPQYRHSDDSERPSPVPNNRHFMWRLPRHNVQSTRSIAYPERAVFKWLPTGLENDNHFPSSVCLKQISLEPTKKTGQNPSLVLVNSRLGKDKDEEGRNVSGRPWESVAENVWPDLLSCLENVRKKMKCQDLEEVYPKFVARFGKNIFHGNASRWFDNVRKGQLPETTLGKLNKSFNTNVSTSYTEKIIREAVPKIGVGFDDKKDIYHVRVIHFSELNISSFLYFWFS